MVKNNNTNSLMAATIQVPPGKVAGVVSTPWSSKINWTQVIAIAAALASYFGLDLDTKTQAEVLAGIMGVQSLVTWVLRTWFTIK